MDIRTGQAFVFKAGSFYGHMMQSRSMAGKGKAVERFDGVSFDETSVNDNFDEGNFEKYGT